MVKNILGAIMLPPPLSKTVNFVYFFETLGRYEHLVLNLYRKFELSLRKNQKSYKEITSILYFSLLIFGCQILAFSRNLLGSCMIKIFRGGGGRGGHTFKPLSIRKTFAFTHPCFKMFLERSLNDPQPRTIPLQASFTATPSPHPPLLPPKNLDHTLPY